jgi:hypothetical protein
MRRSTRRGFTTGHGSAQADRGDRDQNQQNQEGFLPPFDVALSEPPCPPTFEATHSTNSSYDRAAGTPYDERRGGVALELGGPSTPILGRERT